GQASVRDGDPVCVTSQTSGSPWVTVMSRTGTSMTGAGTVEAARFEPTYSFVTMSRCGMTMPRMSPPAGQLPSSVTVVETVKDFWPGLIVTRLCATSQSELIVWAYTFAVFFTVPEIANVRSARDVPSPSGVSDFVVLVPLICGSEPRLMPGLPMPLRVAVASRTKISPLVVLGTSWIAVTALRLNFEALAGIA